MPNRMQDSSYAFTTHSRYLTSLYAVMTETLGVGSHPEMLAVLAKTMRSANGYQALPTAALKNATENALVMAWMTEAVMNTPLPESVIAVSNNWATVQAYYACYQAFCALTIAHGRPVSKHAAGSQRYAELWVQPGWRIAPWSVSYGAPGWGNCPAIPNVPKTGQTSPVTSHNRWSHFQRCLSSTRKDWIDVILEKKRVAKEKARGRKMKLNSKEVRETTVSMRPATVLDYMYRLRTRSNYEDAAMFVDGPSSVSQSVRFNERLREVTSATMMLQELAVAKVIGEPQMRRLADKTLKSIPSEGREFGLHVRRQFI